MQGWPNAQGKKSSRLPLSTLPQAWAICQQAVGQTADDVPHGSAWHTIDHATTVAHALQMAGQWTLDGPALDLDASIWWFQVRFDAPACPANTLRQLHFGGLATLCRVWLNDVEILASDNMFLAHQVDVTHLLVPQANVLRLRFDTLTPHLQTKRPRPRWRTPMVAHQQLRWLRTSLLGRTPGWTPPAAPVGPWRPIWLEDMGPSAHLVRSTLAAHLDGAHGTLAIDCWFSDTLPAQTSVTAHIHGPSGSTTVALQAAADGHYQVQCHIPGVAPWWPHTHGEPALYTVRVTVADATGAAMAYELGKTGFRTITKAHGDDRFALCVNGTPVFCRGACWMPLDVVSLAASEDAYRQALLQVKAAGMNMLRLAGSTMYETPTFFALCDALGIMVWQDLMFSNMDYPAEDAAFAHSVCTEVHQQLTALQAHPSVAVVCGNSEVEQQAAMWGADKSQWAPPLFHHSLREIAQSLLPHTVYWPSSAHGGAFPHQVKRGTTSYYGVGAYKRPLDDALTSQVAFATECLAFANIPPSSTLRRAPCGEAPQVHAPAWKARVYRDQSVGWDFDDVRDYYLDQLLGLRPEALRAVDPARYLTLGRAVAAEVMGRTMAAWRTAPSACGGALVWFLRDLWASAGCGLVDDQGVPKSVFHALARVQQPLLATLGAQGLNGLALHLINETSSDLETQAELTLYQHGEFRVAQHVRKLAVPARSTQEWDVSDWLDSFVDLAYSHRFGPAAFDLAVVQWRDAAGHVIGQALHFEPQQLIAFNGNPGLSAWATAAPDGCIVVQLSTRAVSYGVHFESYGWQADDEFFHMPPGSQRSIRFSPTLPGHSHWHASAIALNGRQSCPIPLQTPSVAP
ncbi:glycoside hydrolase family 2 protein [Rhodoferax aquaticus]|uniref:beta-mannosidase n=1 Tax=Rhodoferax aquaticus TaxID=2527691 RepID=A0A515ET13_9BURK|nr:glycoside hydrolase family 2 protein [Rhodoferax aquaticus]QDL55817.1 glycoside hydrolase family 2 protein [Rhodoferax aquaticus]